MTAPRRIGTVDSVTRGRLLDVAERLMLTEGYAAVTTRRIGREAGVTSPLVHYYFRTMDELFLDLFRRRAEHGYRLLEAALEERRLLDVIWRQGSDPEDITFNLEFAALANHRKVIRAEIAHWAERVRALQLSAAREVVGGLGLAEQDWPPAAVLLGLIGINQLLAIEQNLGVSGGHAETVAFVERWVQRLTEGQLPGGHVSKGE